MDLTDNRHGRCFARWFQRLDGQGRGQGCFCFTFFSLRWCCDKRDASQCACAAPGAY